MEEKKELNPEMEEEEVNDSQTSADAGTQEQEPAGEAENETETPEEGETEEAETEETEKAGKEGSEKDQAEGKEKGGFFRKKEKKDKKDEKIAELTDRVQRQMAEFDNFRKRTEKEKSQMFEMGAKNIIEKLLPVVDNFERGLTAIPEEEQGTPFAEGMEKIYKQLMNMFEDVGVKAIEAEGKEFDPNLHNAVMHIDDESFGENIVAEELQKGYMYRDTVVRHSMVKVAN